MVFGAVVAALIYALGDISAAHSNRQYAGFLEQRFFRKKQVLPYILECIKSFVLTKQLRSLGIDPEEVV